MKRVRSILIAAIVGASSIAGMAVTVAQSSVNFTYMQTIGSPGSGDGQFFLPQGITVQPTNQSIWISDGEGDRLQVFDRQGNFVKTVGGPEFLDEPADLTFNKFDGNVYVGDVFNSQIDVFNAKGNYLRSFGSFGGPVEGRAFFGPGGLAFNRAGNLYVTDFSRDYIQVFNPQGTLIKTIGSSGSESDQFLGPSGISISQASGKIYVGDQLNNRIKVLDSEGNTLLMFGESGTGPGQFDWPIGVEIDEFENIYVADSRNNRVQVFDKNGTFMTAYGEAAPSAGPPPAPLPPGSPLPEPGQFGWTAGVHYAFGKLYVGDFFNSRVLKLDVDNVPRCIGKPRPELCEKLLRPYP
jgi:DNA-binding beta-propeller fold protein YncE